MSVVAPARRARALAVGCLVLALSGCGLPSWTPTLHPEGDAPPDNGGADAYLKVHTHSGELYVLDSWAVPAEGADLVGSGVLFDLDRVSQGVGNYSIPSAQIALLETNQQETVGAFGVSGLALFSVLSGVVTLACLADPKSCFGSCPTFYAVDDSDRPLAEGFSSSFARTLEARDVDNLGVRAESGAFSLVMRNEALETHAVRHVRLRAVASATGPVMQTAGGELLKTSGRRVPSRCESIEGDCLAAVEARDDIEYAPRTDATDLAVREEVVLDFGAVVGDVGVVLSARNSFVTTYVFYQSLAYSGRNAGDLMAALERGEPGVQESVLGVARELGGIETLVSDAGGPWKQVGDFNEAGPIAADRQILRIGSVDSDGLRVKLRMAQGSWRIDEVGLTEIDDVVTPVTLTLDSVTTSHPADPNALDRLTDPERHLVTIPGDEYRLWFTIPEGGEHELFLDTQGYYYEWMRDGWLDEESSASAAAVLLRPREALRLMAPAFKKLEPEMDRLFWSSRFRRESQ